MRRTTRPTDLDRTREWILSHGVCDVAHVDRVARAMVPYKTYFDSIRPVPFLHDTTTKNVLIADGTFSGIVDIDDLCFGDPLFVVALTNMALLSSAYERDYITYWCDALKLSELQRKVVALYTALFCVTFMGEVGQMFNREIAEADVGQLRRYERILGNLLEGDVEM